eukprot:12062928-Karenia_brevis.AAC.1
MELVSRAPIDDAIGQAALDCARKRFANTAEGELVEATGIELKRHGRRGSKPRPNWVPTLGQPFQDSHSLADTW